MAESAISRSESYARRFEEVQDEFIRLVGSLDGEQWRKIGANYPQRINDEDEGRPVGVIAHHVASTQKGIFDRIEKTVRGEPLPPLDVRGGNAKHAVDHAGATREEVLTILRANRDSIPGRLRGIPDEKFDVLLESLAGPMTVAQRIERVLIGHTSMHKGSIEAALS